MRFLILEHATPTGRGGSKYFAQRVESEQDWIAVMEAGRLTDPLSHTINGVTVPYEESLAIWTRYGWREKLQPVLPEDWRENKEFNLIKRR